MSLNVSLQPKSTTAAVIADALRSAILQGTLKSNQPLRQDDLASQFGVSKIPLREALVQLQSEGLVTIQPSRGAIVSALSPAEADEIYTMRIALETVVLRKAIPNLVSADFIKANSILQLIDTVETPLDWAKLNWEFHSILYTPANMPLLLNTLRILSINVARYFVIYQALAYRDHSQAEHRNLLAACKAGDSNLACTHLENHLSAAAKKMAVYLTN
ncbi:MAG TPA: GntR family transcriptional regulator [Anaerolineae bacterium]|nr:GntR family transcriptional regulator [Anaerolineae bacterium]